MLVLFLQPILHWVSKLACTCPLCPFLQEMHLRLCTSSLAFQQASWHSWCSRDLPIPSCSPNLPFPCLLVSHPPSKSSSFLPLPGSPSGFLGPSHQGQSCPASVKALVMLPHYSGFRDVRDKIFQLQVHTQRAFHMRSFLIVTLSDRVREDIHCCIMSEPVDLC